MGFFFSAVAIAVVLPFEISAARGIVVVVVVLLLVDVVEELVDELVDDDVDVVVELLIDAGAVVMSGVGGAVTTLLASGDVVVGVGVTVDVGDGVEVARVVVGA